MNLSQLLDTDERGVSPVIGVILMVAITVILAAVIGTFVLGLGDQVQETSPNAQWSWDIDDSNDQLNITLTHQSGETVDASEISFESDAIDDDNTGTPETVFGASQISAADSAEFSTDDENSDSYIQLDEVANDIEGETIRVAWSSPDGDRTATLTQFTIPEGDDLTYDDTT